MIPEMEIREPGHTLTQLQRWAPSPRPTESAASEAPAS